MRINLLWVLLLLALFTVVGPMDYADALDREAELKVLRAELAALRTRFQPQARPAPLGVNCAARQYYADQSDGRWLVRCVDADFTARRKP